MSWHVVLSWHVVFLALLLFQCHSDNVAKGVVSAASRPNHEEVAGFELIHRHSRQLEGFIYNDPGPPNSTLERVKQLISSDNARQGTISHLQLGQRRKAFELVDLPIRSAADRGLGQYFVSLRIGSPHPQRFVLVADTGSDLTWMNCKYRCPDCPKDASGPTGRFFNANLSPSFKPIPCSTNVCTVGLAGSFSLVSCPSQQAPCRYDYRYSDGTRVLGVFANETVSVRMNSGKRIKLPNVMIGCTGTQQLKLPDADGVMGLGYSPYSFAVKIAQQFDNKFSYCLVDHLAPSDVQNSLNFGPAANLTMETMQYTDLLFGYLDPFYAINVSGISVGDKMLAIPAQVWIINDQGQGGVLIDSGSSLTYLVDPAYNAVMDALQSPLRKFEKAKINVDPMVFCFNDKGYDESVVPRLVFHFANGAKFVPPVKSYVLDADEGVKCLGFVSVPWPGSSVIGNIMQQNFLWEFDLGAAKLGFAPSTCATGKTAKA